MKKLLNIFIMTLLITSTIFAKNGLEIGLFVPFGISTGINTFSLKDKYPKTEVEKAFKTFKKQNIRDPQAGFDSGLLIHLGYKFDINKDFSFSLLGELGYSHDTFSYKRSSESARSKKNITEYTFESMIFGIYPKFNYNNFSFGIGFGIKVPLYGISSHYSYDYDAMKIKAGDSSIKASQVKDIFEVPIIPYLKVSVEYAIYNSQKFDILLGGYIGGDFGMKFKNVAVNNQILSGKINHKISSFDIAFQIGTRIKPMQ